MDDILLYVDNGNIMAQIGESSIILLPNAEGMLPCKKNVIFDSKSLIVISPDVPISSEVYYIDTTRSSSAYLGLSIIETQGNNSWCAAYATAIILRYLESSTTTPTAYGLMTLFYRNPAATDPFETSYVLSAAQFYGYSPVYVGNSLNSSVVFNQIDSGKPIFINSRRYDNVNGEYHYHALVLRGYSRNSDAYSIWNPWNNYYETMDMITKQYVASSTRIYTWYSSVYDW